MAGAHAEQKDAVWQRRGKNGRTAFKLLAHVLAAVANRFQPTIRFLSHDFSNSACFSADTVSTPEPRSTLIVAKVCASGFTPPVAGSSAPDAAGRSGPESSGYCEWFPLPNRTRRSRPRGTARRADRKSKFAAPAVKGSGPRLRKRA